MATITKLLEQQDAEQIAKTVAKGDRIVLDSGENSWELLPEDIMVERRFPENIVVSDNAQPILALDVEITPQLHLEGLSRDIVRHIQQSRKEAGLEIQDHISICCGCCCGAVSQAIEKHRDYICSETLCDNMQIVVDDADLPDKAGGNDDAGIDADTAAGTVREIKIGNEVLKLIIKKQ